MKNEKINKYEKIWFAKYSNFSQIWNHIVNRCPANNVVKVGRHNRKYVILIFYLFFRFFIQVGYIWVSCFVLFRTTFRELIFAKNHVWDTLEEWNFAYCAWLVFWLFDLSCNSVSTIVRRKMLHTFSFWNIFRQSTMGNTKICSLFL